ncbi:MAG: T9SS type A sorting domain-containing protein [Crocinitomix sp.]|nr:T9SS type A sorting domain-containing protein [Crocinitomix sp.]
MPLQPKIKKSHLLFLLLNFLLINANGQFGVENNLTEKFDGSISIHSSDLDGDGDLDVIISSWTLNVIVWFENIGDNQFSKKKLITSDVILPNSVFTADLDGDGDEDVLSASRGDHKIAWYENLGDGFFGTQSIIADSALIAVSVNAADFDGDGDIDVVSASRYDSKIAWYENIGGGEFEDEVIISTDAIAAEDVSIADLDMDGDLDVLSASFNDDKIAWYENEAGIFSDEIVISVDAEGASEVESADLDGDGDLDVISVSKYDNKLAWYENIGGGLFTSEILISDGLTDVNSVSTQDIDGDGDIDILTQKLTQLVWFENIGGGTFGEAIVISDLVNNIDFVQLSDLNGDGNIDVLAVARLENKAFWHENLGAGIFGIQRDFSPTAAGVTSVTAADLDNDGDVDAITASPADTKLSWYENLGNNEFGVQIIISNVSEVASVDATDIDNDGDIDLVTASQSDDRIAWYENLGDGSFGLQIIISEAADGARFVFCADLNNDGNIDVLSSSSVDDKIAWYENLGDGSFGSQVVISLECIDPFGIFAKDLDNDGDIDVMVSSQTDDKVSWFENLGDGVFGPRIILSDVANNTLSVYASDLDNDGDNDVLATSWNDGKLAWFENLGAGVFESEKLIVPNLFGASAVKTDDIDGDGDEDIFVTYGGFTKSLYWIENLGEGNFLDRALIGTSLDDPFSIYVADIDNDLDNDVFAISRSDDKLVWYENNLVHPRQVSGDFFLDLNENGIKDSSELFFVNANISSSPANEFAFKYDDGHYFMNFGSELDVEYEVSPIDHALWGITSDSLSYHVLVDDAYISVDSLDFGFAPNMLVDSINCQLTGAFPRCNTLVNYWIDYINEGTTFPGGIIKLELDDDILFFDAEVAPDSIIGQNVFWHYDSLFYFSNGGINLQVEMPDFLSMGDTLTSVLAVQVDSMDVTLFETFDTLAQILRCAYDPNDKIANPEGVDSLGFIPPSVEQIEYTIRFQNTGTDTAFFVKITDHLDDNIDWESFEMLASSHEMDLTIFPTGEVVFEFENIELPDSTTNFAGSQGFVKYIVQLNEGIPLGTSIYNTANIYFDSNPAVITNTEINTLYDCSLILSSLEFETTICENYLMEGLLAVAPSNGTYLWELETIVSIESDTFSWFADTTGMFTLTLNIETDFCVTDTSFDVTVLPESQLILDTLQFCAGDSVLVFDDYKFETGLFYDTLVSATFCDSVLIQSIIAFELPTVNYMDVADDTLCILADSTLMSGTPSGGVFTGPGIITDYFHPESAGEGLHTLFYTYEDENGCASSDSLHLFVTDCLTIQESNSYAMSIYPNPAQDNFLIEFPQNLSNQYEVLVNDMSGRVITRLSNVENEPVLVNSERWSPGVYVIKIYTLEGNLAYSTKLVIE